MAGQWEVKSNGKVLGPFTDSQMEQLMRSGRVDPDSIVRRSDNETWTAAGDTPGLFGNEDGSSRVATHDVDDIMDEVLLGKRRQSSNTQRKASEELDDPFGDVESGTGTKLCPFCAESIQTVAVKCKHCGEFLDSKLRASSKRQSFAHIVQPPTPPPSGKGGTAAVLSFLFPGLGQIYKGQIFKGIFALVITTACYCVGFAVFVPSLVVGLIMHLFLIVDAYSGEPQ